MSQRRTNYKGDWTASTIYDKHDSARYNGVVYVAKEIHESVSGSTPDIATYQWHPMTKSTKSQNSQIITPYIPLQRPVHTPIQKLSWPAQNWHLT